MEELGIYGTPGCLPWMAGGNTFVSLRLAGDSTFIKLDLYLNSKEGTIGGVLHGGLTLDFDLFKA